MGTWLCCGVGFGAFPKGRWWFCPPPGKRWRCCWPTVWPGPWWPWDWTAARWCRPTTPSRCWSRSGSWRRWWSRWANPIRHASWARRPASCETLANTGWMSAYRCGHWSIMKTSRTPGLPPRRPVCSRCWTARWSVNPPPYAWNLRYAQLHECRVRISRLEQQMYTAKGTLDRDAQLRKYSGLVHKLAHHMMAKLPASVEVDDLIQVGMIGLTEALARYEPSQGVQFETFASQRIRGAMLDELRDSDWMSRGSRKMQKDIEHAVQRLEQRLHRVPKESEIAEEMGMSLSDYQQALAKVRGTQLVYLEDMAGRGDEEDHFLDRYLPTDAQADPQAMLRDQRMHAASVGAINKLPEREQYVMSMYYEHDMNLKEIAAVLGVTESRVCQLHSQSIARLRARLREH